MSKAEASVNAMNLRMAIRGREQSFLSPTDKSFDWSSKVYRKATGKRAKNGVSA